MELDEIAANPRSSLTFMERYVNEGSPSGFTFINTTSERTRPRGSSESFHLAEITPKENVVLHQIGELPSKLFMSKAASEQAIFVHPDMLQHPRLNAVADVDRNQSWFSVEPTSSARTVRLNIQNPDGFLKLHHEAHLGRIIRRITVKHAQAAIETDTLLASMIDAGKMPHTFAFYREVGARVLSLRQEEDEINWGMIWRPAQVFGRQVHRVVNIIPAFSLFSHDYCAPTDRTLLEQLGAIHASNRIRFLQDELLIPLVDSYFAMLIGGGLQGEWHPQNVLFGFDASWHCVATILRDLESIDRDLPLMTSALHSSVRLKSYPYKCLKNSGENYGIRHSFMFDHKFGEYLLSPLIDHASSLWDIDSAVIDRCVIDKAETFIQQLPSGFFPNGCWYKFAHELIDQSVLERPYVRLDRPRFRPVRRSS